MLMADVRTESFTGFRPLVVMPNKNVEEPDDMDSGSDAGSEIEENSLSNHVDAEKLESTHREILEKLKRQDQEERAEIERELREAHRDALERANRHHEMRSIEMRSHDMRAEDLRMHHERLSPLDSKDSLQSMRGMADTPLQTEIRSQRPPGLLAQHGLTTKSHSSHLNSSDKEFRVKEDRELRDGDRNSRESREREFRERDIRDERDRDYRTDRDREERDRDFRLDRDHRDSESRERYYERQSDYRHMHPTDYLNHPAFMPSPYGDRYLPRSPPLPIPLPSSPGSHGSDSRPPSVGALEDSPTNSGHHWTFEEQFKQLYELSDDPKRREFLDDLFAYMQKRGTPVNRIPIMAKQTLDLYELFRLVVSKGGLVEVINKKLWREITKGLNLPSSITSAAFTLRTQYMKYLYPYECEKLKLSTPSELQAAIDGNRREGRRPSYGYDFAAVPTMIPTPPPHMNGGLMNGRPHADWGTYWKSLTGVDDDHPLPPTPAHIRNLAERDARAMEAATRAMEEATKRMEESRVPGNVPPLSLTSNHNPSSNRDSPKIPTPNIKLSQDEPPTKRHILDDERLHIPLPPPSSVPSAHLKITSRNDGRSEFDNSLVVSMEVNGIMYQGVLFAQHLSHHRRL